MYNPYWQAKIALIIYDSGLLMEFGGNQASRTLKSLIWGWHVALSKNNKTCWFCIFILPLKAINHASMICDVIHAFLLDLHSTGSFRMSRFRKHRGFAALPITKGFSVSPDIKPDKKQSIFLCRVFHPNIFHLSDITIYSEARGRTVQSHHFLIRDNEIL